MSILSLCSLYNFTYFSLLSYMSSLSILEINPLSIQVCKYILLFHRLLFHLVGLVCSHCGARILGTGVLVLAVALGFGTQTLRTTTESRSRAQEYIEFSTWGLGPWSTCWWGHRCLKCGHVHVTHGAS